MKASWTNGLGEDEAKEMESYFKQSLRLRKRLEKLLEDELESIENQSISKEGYDTPNWSLKQADFIGRKASIKKIISLISEKS